VAKGGTAENTVGRKCLCNALLANVGHPQVRNGAGGEPALVTVGDDLNSVAQFLAPGRESYSAADVVASMLSLTSDAVSAEQSEIVLASA
jgi:nitronate monooxygenase